MEQPAITEENKLYQGVENLPPDLWKDLALLKPENVAPKAGVSFNTDDGYRIPFIGIDYLVHPEKRTIVALAEGKRVSFQAGLVLLNYLIHASGEGISGKMVAARELSGGELFFNGPHALSTEPILQRFACNGKELLALAQAMGATSRTGGDACFRLWALPNIMVEYTLYEKDDEFPADLSITFDAHADRHLPLDSIWALVNIITHRLAGS